MSTLEATLTAIAREFETNFKERGELGASLSIWMGETEVCSLHRGFRDRDQTIPWDENTLAPVWSATKGPASACVLLALHDKGLNPDSSVGEVWPELANGTLREQPLANLLSHQCGLCALDSPPPISDYEAVIQALETQQPAWDPGSQHGYHPRTFGFLTEELVRRLSGKPLGEFWRQRIADALELDFWIGLPESQDGRVAEMIPGRNAIDPSSEPFYAAFADPKSLSARSFISPRGLGGVSEINRQETRRLSLPAMGGIGSARALGQFYAVLAKSGKWMGFQLIPEVVCLWAEQLRTSGDDLVLLSPSAFSAGFMKDPLKTLSVEQRRKFGPSPRAFGHPGAGGSHAFADPASGIGFAYVMNQMERTIFPTWKALSIVRRLYQT